MLTKRQLKKIEAIIRRRFAVFTLENIGPEALSDVELDELKRLGLLRRNVTSFISDGHTLGKITQLLSGGAHALTYDEVLRQAKKMLPAPTEVELKMIDWANRHAATYIQGLRDSMVKEVGAAASRSAGAAIRAVRDEVASTIKNRRTAGQLKSDLFHAIDDKYRDWQRVASTELQSAIQNGIYDQIREVNGPDQLVYKRPNPDACKHCKRLFLEDDGITPKVFILSELEDNNFGRRAADWHPTVSPVHPWCRCQLQMIPEGYDFVKQRQATENFTTALGREIPKGTLIPPSLRLTPQEIEKTKFVTPLRFTGNTAAKSIRKSVIWEPSDMDDDCICRY